MAVTESDEQDAKKLANLLLRSNTWMHRRVERIMIEPTGESTRHISIDYTTPSEFRIRGSSDDTALIPLGLHRKGPLTGLSVWDSGGRPMPLLGTKDNGRLAVSMLLQLVNGSVNNPEVDLSSIEALIRKVVETRPGQDSGLRTRIEQELSGLGVDATSAAILRKVILQFEKNFLMVVEMCEVVEGRRSILKFEYRESRVHTELGHNAPKLQWEIRDFGMTESVHVEFVAPSLLAVRSARLVRQAESEQDGTVIVGVDVPTPTVHLAAVPTNRFSPARLELDLSPLRFGAILGMLWGPAGMAAVVLTATIVHLLRLAEALPRAAVSPSIPALMLAVGGLLLTWIARSPEDWTTSVILSRARRSLILSALLAGGVAVYLSIPVPEPARTLGWVGLTMLGILNAIAAGREYSRSHIVVL